MIHTYLHMRIFVYDTEWQTSNVLNIIEKQIYRLVKYCSSDRRNSSTFIMHHKCNGCCRPFLEWRNQ